MTIARSSSLTDALTEVGLDEELKAIQRLNKLILEAREDSEPLIHYALELIHLSKKHQLSYQEVIEDYQTKQAQLNTLSDQITELNHQQTELRATLNKLESKHQSMEHTITEYRALKKRLNDEGLSIFDLDTLINVLKSIKELDNDPELIQSYLKQSDTILTGYNKHVKKNIKLKNMIQQQKRDIENNDQSIALQKSIYMEEKKKLQNLRENEFLNLRKVQTQAESQIRVNHNTLNQLSKETTEVTARMLNQLIDTQTRVNQITTEFAPLASLHPLHQLLTTGQGNPLTLSLILGVLLSKYRVIALNCFKSPSLDPSLQTLINELDKVLKIQ